MDHPTNRLLARYALGDITNEDELAEFEAHLLECADCSRKAMAVDLIGAEDSDKNPTLHIAGASGALCGDASSRNVISEILLPGLDATLVCPQCLARLRGRYC
jgi:hypothetical protein